MSKNFRRSFSEALCKCSINVRGKEIGCGSNDKRYKVDISFSETVQFRIFSVLVNLRETRRRKPGDPDGKMFFVEIVI